MSSAALAQVLADLRGDAQVFRKNGHTRDAEVREKIAEQVAIAAEDYLRWISEEDAQLRSGWSRQRLRAHFPEWERQEYARRDGRRRWYLMLIVPQRANTLAAREAGHRAVRKAS